MNKLKNFLYGMGSILNLLPCTDIKSRYSTELKKILDEPIPRIKTFEEYVQEAIFEIEQIVDWSLLSGDGEGKRARADTSANIRDFNIHTRNPSDA